MTYDPITNLFALADGLYSLDDLMNLTSPMNRYLNMKTTKEGEPMPMPEAVYMFDIERQEWFEEPAMVSAQGVVLCTIEGGRVTSMILPTGAYMKVKSYRTVGPYGETLPDEPSSAMDATDS